MPANLKIYLYIGIITLVIAAGAWAYGIYNDYQALKLEHGKLQQNELALRDSLEQKADSLNKTTTFVRDLNEQLVEKSGLYVALQAKFSAYVDSVHKHGTAVAVVTDSTVTVPFSGHASIVDYTGSTFYNIRTHDARWDIAFTFPNPILVGAGLVEEEGIWKFNTWSLTAGVKVMGTGTLDNDTYRRLQKYAPPTPQKRFLLGGVVGQYGGLGAGYSADNWTVLGYYTLINSSLDVYRNVNVGLFWHPF